MAVKNNDDVNRAAQFLPFDALKGLSEELQSRIEKRTRVPRHEFSDEKKEELSKTLVRVDNREPCVLRATCYVLCYRLGALPSFVDGCIPLALIGVVSVVIAGCIGFVG